MKKTLTKLISPKSSQDFFKSYENNQHFVVHGLTSSVKELTELPFLKSLDDLLNSWPKDIQAHLPDVKDEASSIDTTSKDARKLFDNGMGLLFNYAETISPVLQNWLLDLRLDLGLSSLTIARCLLYATPKNGGTAPHFDQNINFVYQVSGNKTWWIAKNNEVINPLTRHTMRLPVDPELASYAENEMLESMPDDAEKIEMTAGSLLFVPRGAWHSTNASTDALSLNFTFTAPTWLDLFTAALRGRLAQSPEWRATADGVSDFEKADAAAEKFDQLLAELVMDLPHWRAGHILGATETD